MSVSFVFSLYASQPYMPGEHLRYFATEIDTRHILSSERGRPSSGGHSFAHETRKKQIINDQAGDFILFSETDGVQHVGMDIVDKSQRYAKTGWNKISSNQLRSLFINTKIISMQEAAGGDVFSVHEDGSYYQGFILQAGINNPVVKSMYLVPVVNISDYVDQSDYTFISLMNRARWHNGNTWSKLSRVRLPLGLLRAWLDEEGQEHSGEVEQVNIKKHLQTLFLDVCDTDVYVSKA